MAASYKNDIMMLCVHDYIINFKNMIMHLDK